MLRPNSLRARMTLLFTGAFAALLWGLVLAGWLTESALASQHAQRLLYDVEQRVDAEYRQDGPRMDWRELVEDLHPLDGEPLFVVISDERGRVVGKSSGLTPPRPGQPTRDWRVRSFTRGGHQVVAGFYWKPTAGTLRLHALWLLALCAILTPAAAGGVWLLVGHTLSPIQRLTDSTAAASTQSLRVTLVAPSSDAELVGLVETLNGLLTRLADTALARGRFYAAASHELRTPLQALSGHLELALTRHRSAAEYEQVIREAYAQTQRLTRLVQDLLLLNQLERGTASRTAEEVSVSETAGECLRWLDGQITERGSRVACRWEREIRVRSSSGHLAMLIRNLVENAVRHAPPRGEVAISTRVDGDAPTLVIDNDYPADAPLNLAALAEPFSRQDASRASSTGGNGLGLAICQAIAAHHGWGVAWSREGGQVRVTVRFPSAHSEAAPDLAGAASASK